MCGIAGLMSLTGRPLERPYQVRTMMDRLVHRGPDEAGTYINRTGMVSLGHRRLRIIDLESGRQPLGNEDGSVMVVFNGEIYGFQALRRSLQERGHRFRTKTDTEVIVHLYEEEGIESLARLKGMFAMAIWDDRAGTLLLARDRVGKKPLYYAFHRGTALFASELHALAAVPGLSKELDELALDQYFTFGYIPAPRTIYRHVRKLEPGHFLLLTSQGSAGPRAYWTPQTQGWNNYVSGDPEGMKEELIRRLRAATELRMVSDVPIGCFLSGGMDSSAVLSFMAELTPHPIKTFSIGFPEEGFSELRYARSAARYFGTDHHEYVLEAEGVDVLDELVMHFGEPFADASALPTWHLSKLTRKSVTVALTGDGGDELFGGYNWYRTDRFLMAASHLPAWIARLGSKLKVGSRLRPLDRIERLAGLLTLEPHDRYAALRRVISPEVKRLMYAPEFLDRVHESAMRWLADRYERTRMDDPLNRSMATDLMTYLAEGVLVKVDRMSMAHALECRSPLLDTDVVEWAIHLPTRYKFAVGCGNWIAQRAGQSRGKWLLREAVRSRLPAGFLDRPKQGFDVPLERWFKEDLRAVVTDRVLHGPLGRLERFSASGLQRIVNEHFEGRANHAQAIWALLVLSSWVVRYAD